MTLPLSSPASPRPATPPAPTAGGPAVTLHLSLTQLVMGRYRPRQRFDAAALDALARSLASHGVAQPLLVRPLEGGEPGEGRYEIVAGERRYLAAQQLGLTHLPAVVRRLSDEAALELSLVENLQREDLNELEQAEGVLRLLALRLGREVGGVRSLLYRMDNEAKHKVTQQVLGSEDARTVERVFAELGTLSWASFVSTRLPLFSLPPDVLEALRAGVLSAAGARLLGRLRDPADRAPLLAEVWDAPPGDAELRRRVLTVLGASRSQLPAAQPPAAQPGPPAARLTAWAHTLLGGRRWRSPARQARAQALLEELAQLLCAEEDDDAPVTP
ncbi:ParB/RepB/Spo0J family partition protein [Deinococcus planocerae]|uniref:ParB/RepB/Spo0J family partition protein n=1 Tax=Deinococcus planocerae TaxID=1737569 RepID=UPI000C7EF0C0|nr:ParB/RepB/Spo0J family partition protein [Deinococcus planocerae]